MKEFETMLKWLVEQELRRDYIEYLKTRSSGDTYYYPTPWGWEEFKKSRHPLNFDVEKETCPICYNKKRPDNIICTTCNDNGWIETGIKIRRLRESLKSGTP